MKQRLHTLFQRLHAQQSGAIALLLLAAILILFMSALVIFDTGQAAADKMEVQIGTDSAAFSHSVIKARSMNMLAYSNTVKRMIFSYLATYINAWLAIILLMAYHAAKCFKIFPNVSSCITFFKGVPMVVAEGLELFFANAPSMSVWPLWDGQGRSRAELMSLENYQRYMIAITPWWAYVEGVTRGMTNGALVTAAWPPPGSVVSEVKAAVASVAGGALTSYLPSITTTVDALPVSRRDGDSTWTFSLGPFSFSAEMGGTLEYCMHYMGSLESLVTGIQTYITSNDDPTRWKETFAFMHLLPSIGCFLSGLNYRDSGGLGAYFQDYRLKKQYDTKQKWLGATGSTHIGYIPHAGRNAMDGDRQKFGYVSHEAVVDRSIFANEGYFAMARSEIVYKQPFDVLGSVANFTGTHLGVLGEALNHRFGIQHEPDMWSPRWKSKNRPLILPGEQFGSTIHGTEAGLNTVVNDTVPFLALGAFVGLVDVNGDPPFSVGSAVNDFLYLLRSSSTFNAARIQGLPK